MDLMFLYNTFFEPLPESSNDFKREINQLFPHVYDTKHLLNTRMSLKNYIQNLSPPLSKIFEQIMEHNYSFNQKISIH